MAVAPVPAVECSRTDCMLRMDFVQRFTDLMSAPELPDAIDNVSNSIEQLHGALKTSVDKRANNKGSVGCCAPCFRREDVKVQAKLGLLRNKTAEVEHVVVQLKPKADVVFQALKLSLSGPVGRLIEQIDNLRRCPSDPQSTQTLSDMDPEHLRAVFDTASCDELLRHLGEQNPVVASFVTDTVSVVNSVAVLVETATCELRQLVQLSKNSATTSEFDALLESTNQIYSRQVTLAGLSRNLQLNVQSLGAFARGLQSQLSLASNRFGKAPSGDTRSTSGNGDAAVDEAATEIVSGTHVAGLDRGDSADGDRSSRVTETDVVVGDASTASQEPSFGEATVVGSGPKPRTSSKIVERLRPHNGEEKRLSEATRASEDTDMDTTFTNAPSMLSTLSGSPDPRYDFGPALISRCSQCRKLTRNRGDKETGKIYCRCCFVALGLQPAQ